MKYFDLITDLYTFEEANEVHKNLQTAELIYNNNIRLSQEIKMKTNTTVDCEESCSSEDELREKVAFASGVYLVIVGITSASFNLKALIRATTVNINFFNPIR